MSRADSGAPSSLDACPNTAPRLHAPIMCNVTDLKPLCSTLTRLLSTQSSGDIMQHALLRTACGMECHSPCAYAHHRSAVQTTGVCCALPAPGTQMHSKHTCRGTSTCRRAATHVNIPVCVQPNLEEGKAGHQVCCPLCPRVIAGSRSLRTTSPPTCDKLVILKSEAHQTGAEEAL